MSFGDRLKHAWNAFLNKDPTPNYNVSSYSYRPDRPKLTKGNERSIVSAVFNRIAVDAAQIDIEHCRVDENDRFIEHIKDDLNYCLVREANKDQTARQFILDAVLSLCDEGVIAIVPIDTDIDPLVSSSYSIRTMRTAKILQWYPDEVQIRVYNDRKGTREDIIVKKRNTAIVENPFYNVMNEPNSVAQRLIRKLLLLDVVDESSSSGKLDLIIQLPYVIKSEARKKQAEIRRKEIDDQLNGSRRGIAYTDGTEHITQLNRPSENNLLAQIEYLQNLLFSQLGITDSIMNGTATPTAMNNYYSRTIEPILSAIVEEMSRKFLTKNAYARGETIKFFRKPFKLLPLSDIAATGDSLLRNEILTSNEMRQIMGYIPSDTEGADDLHNPNMPDNSKSQNGAKMSFTDKISVANDTMDEDDVLDEEENKVSDEEENNNTRKKRRKR